MAGLAPFGNGRTGVQRFLYRWHRRIGLLAGLLGLLLAVTGILLSHAQGLGLHERTVAHPWLMWIYGVEPSSPPLAGKTSAGWLVWLDGRLYLDGRPLARGFKTPIGTAAADGMIAVAGAEELLLLTSTGQIVERLGPASLPGRVDAIGTTEDDTAAVRSGGEIFATRDFLAWQKRPHTPVRWAVRWNEVGTEVPRSALAPALAAYRGEGVPLARIVADLHSGRFLGAVGPYLMDATAIALILLAGSGLVMWWKREPNRFKRTGRPG